MTEEKITYLNRNERHNKKKAMQYIEFRKYDMKFATTDFRNVFQSFDKF